MCVKSGNESFLGHGGTTPIIHNFGNECSHMFTLTYGLCSPEDAPVPEFSLSLKIQVPEV
jgi:hypothetical protein